jgi:ubiquinone biosynthesis protein
MLPPTFRIPWFSRRPLIKRSQQVASTFTRHGLGMLLNRSETASSDGTGLHPSFSSNRRAQASQIVQALGELGPTFIKFGQALSARSDILPPEYIEALNSLQDLVPPAPFEQVKKVLQTELGKDPQVLFAELNPEPIASASIGQVYAARLWGGDEVVVKIVRPEAEKTFEQDLEILGDMAAWASRHTAIGELYDLPVLIEELAYTVRAEFDYQREGHNADLFRSNFADDPNIYIPVVYWEYTTRQVITLERVHGLKINNLAGLDAARIDRQKVAENLMTFALRQIFDFRMYHADPHPGNFFVQPDASLAVVDFGMVGRINERTKRTFLGIAQAVERQDSFMLVDELLEAGIYNHGVDRRSFARELERLMDHVSSSSIRDLSASQVMQEMMSIVLRNGLQLPGELVAMTRAITISEGTGTLLYPDFNLFSFAAPHLREFWKEERSPKAMGPRITAAALDGFELGLDFPRRVQRLMTLLERGEFQVNLKKDEADELLGKLQAMTNRITLGMILAAVIISLSLVTVVYQNETWQAIGNFIFGFALISSIIFGIWLVWSMIRSRR